MKTKKEEIGKPKKENKKNTKPVPELTKGGVSESVEVVSEKRRVGKPLKFESVEELDRAIDNYIASCKAIDETTGREYYWRPLTMTALAMALDTSRRVLLDYNEKDGYSHSINKARQACEAYAEEYLYTGKNVAGAIFNMVNNYGWQNKYNKDSSIQVTATQSIAPTNTTILENIQKIQEQLEDDDN